MKRRRRQAEDRLSALPDEMIHHILAQLPSDEAARTSALSRRWRDIPAGLTTVDLIDPVDGDHRPGPSMEDLPVCFGHKVTGAILGKAPETAIRTLRLDVFNPWHDLLDQWIVSAVSSGAEHIDVKLRHSHMSSHRRLCPFGSSVKASADFNQYEKYKETHHHLFRCRTLRRLRLTNWTLDMPGTVFMPALETLCLARIMDPKGQLQHLLSNCPRLADLTLQECPGVTKISLKSACLRSFAMICCHHATRVELLSSCLQSLHYKGGLPLESLFKLANHEGITALKIEICEDLSKRESSDVAPVTGLISQCTELRCLHLSLRPSMAYHDSLFAEALQGLPGLRQLGLQGYLRDDHAVRSVAVLLRGTKNLEVLSLFLQGPPRKKPSWMSDGESDAETEDCDDYGVDRSSRVTDGLLEMYIKCLHHKLRRINIVNYKGLQLESILANILLTKGKTLEEFSVTSPVDSSRRKHQMASQLRSWRYYPHTRVTVNRRQKKL